MSKIPPVKPVEVKANLGAKLPMTPQEVEAKVADLLAGKAKPSSEILAYQVSSINSLRAEGDLWEKEMMKTRTLLQTQEQQMQQLRGAHTKSMRDLIFWIKKEDESKVSE